MRENRAIRRARYSFLQRVLRAAIVERSLLSFLAAYLLLDIALVGAEAISTLYFSQYLPDWSTPELKSMLKDIASYFIAAQVGILGIVSVAIGIVTLISQRDDRSSTNTDVRLYYVESLAYEVVLSGVSLLIVLCVQLLWPLQFSAHVLGFGGQNLPFKVTLTTFHLTWLLINLAVFAQFLLTTLRFVEPKARERLRERYTANVIVPHDLSLRLSGFFYTNAPKELVPETTDKTGPSITFGYGLLDDGEIELQTNFAAQSELHDVWLRPLGIALRNWWKRSEKSRPEPPRANSVLRGRDIRLSISAPFDGTFEGEVDWCRRKGGVNLYRWERWLIRRSFRFKIRRDGKDALPTPSNFLEELADRVIGQIERTAITGFKGALDEFIRYHCFILDAHNTRTDQGQPLSLAEVGGFFEPPYQEWIRQYRRVFEKAADKIGVETNFIETLGHAIIRLLPRDAADISPPVITSLLDLGLHEVIVLEAWVTRRTTVEVSTDQAAQPRLQLAGSERRAYEHVVSTFIGAWENVLRLTDNLYAWKSEKRRAAPEHWSALVKSWPFLERHLRNTAYFLASAIWNEDKIGAERYRDALLRWLDALRPDAQADFQLHHHALLSPDLLSQNWLDIEAHLEPYRRNRWPQTPPPEAVFGIIQRNCFDDVVAVTATVALAWYMNNQQSTDIGARAAKLLLQRQVIEGEGSRFVAGGASPQSIFRSLFSLIVRSALNERPGKSPYGTILDGLVQFLNGMSERRVVPGRIYSSWGWGGLDAVRLHFLAMLAGHLPSEGDDGALAWVREFAADEDLFADGDTSLRRIVLSLEAYAQALGDGLDQGLFERGIRIFVADPDIAAVRLRLKDVFSDAVAIIQDERTKRLRERPVDSNKLNVLASSLENALRPDLYCFRGFNIHKGAKKAHRIIEWRITGIDKGEFVNPMMSWETSNLNQFIVDAFRQCLTQYVWAEFFNREREVVDIDSSTYPDGYWNIVLACADDVGAQPTILVPYDPVGTTITNWTYRLAERPNNLEIQRMEGRQGGGGTGYLATVNGIDVFTAPDDPNHSYLFSALMIKSINYRLVTPDAFISVALDEGDDPRKSEIVVRFSQFVRWRSTSIVELVLKETS
jgi:hypothetical protein